ncbi:MAG: glycosyltransferase family 2 protein [Proteobacteria bacterium]|nr:glycosyltransferase family 2 protein [Pseudomonadota bacterium]
MTVINIIWLIFPIYFVAYYGANFVLNLVAAVSVIRYSRNRGSDVLQLLYTKFEPPVSIIVPAFNEEACINSTVHSLMQISYSEFEVIVVNDGSTDKTLEVLVEEFGLKPFPEVNRIQVKSAPVRNIYRSSRYPNLSVIDKENGGKADSSNAGINASIYPLFCVVDADSILGRNSLETVVEPFVTDPTTVASGGTIRIVNGCQVSDGYLVKVGLPTNPLALFQVVEYLRAFLFGRIGWASMNALILISGAFGLFRKSAVVEIGGFRTDTVGEDMELVIRLHRHFLNKGEPYNIAYVPEPICWTEAPGDLRTLKNQRLRWQRGLSESLTKNMGLLFSRRGGVAGWLAMPFYIVFEWLGPIIEVSGYLFTFIGVYTGLITVEAMWSFFIVAMGFGVFLSISTFLLEEIAFHIYPNFRHLFVLTIFAIIENLGYRQLNSLWRLWGLLLWAFGSKPQWGKMKRKATWQVKGE